MSKFRTTVHLRDGGKVHASVSPEEMAAAINAERMRWFGRPQLIRVGPQVMGLHFDPLAVTLVELYEEDSAEQ